MDYVSYKQEEGMAISASEARRTLVSLIERVNLDRTEIEIVTRYGSAVLMAKDEFDALVETNYLLSSPANARRLKSALQSVRKVEIGSLVGPPLAVQLGTQPYERLRTAIPACVACITWAEIHAVVMRQKGALSGLPSSILSSLHRVADDVARAISWHSSDASF